mmetsp:Transcript_46475/g.149089  ORF Transcript_46475/g.149089 Transcript_46475/m.149089 type:complete len:223 (+) Transcript_46475:1677-2345(+)
MHPSSAATSAAHPPWQSARTARAAASLAGNEPSRSCSERRARLPPATSRAAAGPTEAIFARDLAADSRIPSAEGSLSARRGATTPTTPRATSRSSSGALRPCSSPPMARAAGSLSSMSAPASSRIAIKILSAPRPTRSAPAPRAVSAPKHRIAAVRAEPSLRASWTTRGTPPPAMMAELPPVRTSAAAAAVRTAWGSSSSSSTSRALFTLCSMNSHLFSMGG